MASRRAPRTESPSSHASTMLSSVVAGAFAYSFNTGRASLGVSSHQLQPARAVEMVARQQPHGGTLVDLFADDKAAVAASATATIELNDRQSCDVQLLCNGGFSPLTGFLNEEEYNSVVDDMKLPSGLIFSLPVVMDTSDDAIDVGTKVLLKYDGVDMALLT